MYTIYGFDTPSVQKVLFTIEELGLPYAYKNVNLLAGDHQTADFLKKHPWGKVPVLEHDDGTVVESNAICRYLDRKAGGPLYAGNPEAAAQIDQMIDMIAFHPGRWVATFFFEEVVKPNLWGRNPEPVTLTEAKRFADFQLPEIDRRLGESTYLCGETLTLADTTSLPLFFSSRKTSFSLAGYPNIERWMELLTGRDAWLRARERIGG